MKVSLKGLSCSFLLLFIMGGLILSCNSDKSKEKEESERKEKEESVDTLRVGTLYSPTTYFLYRDEPMGYEYDLAKKYAESNGLVLSLTVAANFPELIALLDSGKIDLMAYPVPMTSEYMNKVLFCGPINLSSQVLVQNVSTKGSEEFIKDVTELVGRDVYVEEGSKYLQRLKNLNTELGGGINIKVIDNDTLVSRDLIEMVAHNEIPRTIVDGELAMLEKTYYKGLDIGVSVSLEQKSSWAVAKGNEILADNINKWSDTISENRDVLEIHRRYFEMEKNYEGQSLRSSGKRMLNPSVISQYDALFKKYAPEIDWDWRLLAAVCYEESRFDNTVTSWAGAGGIMQIMPRTAEMNGLPVSEIRNPEKNIATSIKIFKTLDRLFSKYVSDRDERLKFVLAAYNAGQGHVIDAIALAEKFGKEKNYWEGNVRETILLKSRPEFYSDPVVKNGYFRAAETVAYVDRVLESYNFYKTHAPA